MGRVALATGTKRAVCALAARTRPVVCALAALGALVTPPRREAAAFSCPPDTRVTFLGPDRVDDAPLNAKVRLEVPIDGRALFNKVVLRAHAGPGVAGPVVPAAPRLTRYGSDLGLLELTPLAPLAPATRYEVALVDRASFPPQVVLGTFRTGTAIDTAAPRIERLGAARAYESTEVGEPRGRWVEIEGVGASDAGRPGAQIVFGLWPGNAAGQIDTSKPPYALLRPRGDGSLFVGVYACDRRPSPLPDAPEAWLGLAAVDEAGNVSELRRVRVDLASAAPRPAR